MDWISIQNYEHIKKKWRYISRFHQKMALNFDLYKLKMFQQL